MKFSLKTLLLIAMLLPPMCGLFVHCLNNQSFEIGYYVGYIPDTEYKYYFWEKGNILYLGREQLHDEAKVWKFFNTSGPERIRSYSASFGKCGEDVGAAEWYSRPPSMVHTKLDRTAMNLGNLVGWVMFCIAHFIIGLVLLMPIIITLSAIHFVYQYNIEKRRQYNIEKRRQKQLFYKQCFERR